MYPRINKTNKHDKAWHSRFNELVRYRENFGNCSVPLRFRQNPSLGRWVNRQREAWNKNNLSLKREELLNQIGFDWNQNSSSPSVAWNSRFGQLVRFKQENGHTNVPQNLSDCRYKGLGGWVNRQRTARAKGCMDQDRIGTLDSIKFSWNMKNEAWDIRFHQLIKYKEEKGNCDVPHGYKNVELSKWVQKQRYLSTLKRRGTKTHLTNERESKLNNLGFEWNPSSSSWDNQYQKLQEYYALHGNCCVPRPYPLDEKLSNWVFNQRSEYSRKQRGLKSSLTAEREAKLIEIDFRWTILKKKEARAPVNVVSPEHVHEPVSPEILMRNIHYFRSYRTLKNTNVIDSGIRQEQMVVSELLNLKGRDS